MSSKINCKLSIKKAFSIWLHYLVLDLVRGRFLRQPVHHIAHLLDWDLVPQIRNPLAVNGAENSTVVQVRSWSPPLLKRCFLLTRQLFVFLGVGNKLLRLSSLNGLLLLLLLLASYYELGFELELAWSTIVRHSLGSIELPWKRHDVEGLLEITRAIRDELLHRSHFVSITGSESSQLI